MIRKYSFSYLSVLTTTIASESWHFSFYNFLVMFLIMGQYKNWGNLWENRSQYFNKYWHFLQLYLFPYLISSLFHVFTFHGNKLLFLSTPLHNTNVSSPSIELKRILLLMFLVFTCKLLCTYPRASIMPKLTSHRHLLYRRPLSRILVFYLRLHTEFCLLNLFCIISFAALNKIALFLLLFRIKLHYTQVECIYQSSKS